MNGTPSGPGEELPDPSILSLRSPTVGILGLSPLLIFFLYLFKRGPKLPLSGWSFLACQTFPQKFSRRRDILVGLEVGGQREFSLRALSLLLPQGSALARVSMRVLLEVGGREEGGSFSPSSILD